MSFDQKSDWAQIVAEGDEDSISGDAGIVIIPKTGVPSKHICLTSFKVLFLTESISRELHISLRLSDFFCGYNRFPDDEHIFQELYY